MLGIFRHFSAKTKILLIGIVLIVVPVAVISYLGMDSVNLKATNLKINYTGTVRLVRDKLESGILRLEENLHNSISSTLPGKNNDQLQRWLSELELQNPAFRHILLVNKEKGLLSSKISYKRMSRKHMDLPENGATGADFHRAEQAEFRHKRYSEAIRFYQKALGNTRNNQEQVLLLSRIGRCYFKLFDFEKGIREYRKILDFEDTLVIGNVPARVLALSQISHGYGKLGNATKQLETNILIYRNLIAKPWDMYGGEYRYYLNSVKAELQTQTDSIPENSTLKAELKTLNQEEIKVEEHIEFIQLLRQNVLSGIEITENKKPLSHAPAHKILLNENGKDIHIGLLSLPATFQSNDIMLLAYQFNDAYLIEQQIPHILSSVELGKDYLLGIIGGNDSLLYIQNEQAVAGYLVAENFELLYGNWKVALFNKDGKTLAQVVGREKNLYRILLGGIILLLLFGLVVVIRAVFHEAEMARLKSEFVSNVSHEFKTPLALIRMFGETLDSGIVSDERKRKEFYGIIRKESERLTHLINNVLDFSKMDSGRKKYYFEEADLVKLVKSSLEAYKLHIYDNGFEINSKFPEEEMICKIDKDSISQAVLNLLSNAVKYSKGRKSIEVEVSKDKTSALITVSDKGIGIAKSELKKIFDKFYRISNEKDLQSTGTGLGLTLTRQIVEAHGGEIKAESEPGEGSCFTISIPLSLSPFAKGELKGDWLNTEKICKKTSPSADGRVPRAIGIKIQKEKG